MYKSKTVVTLTVKPPIESERKADISSAAKEDPAFHFPMQNPRGCIRVTSIDGEEDQNVTIKEDALLDAEDAMSKAEAFLDSLTQIKIHSETLKYLVSRLENLGEDLIELKQDVTV